MKNRTQVSDEDFETQIGRSEDGRTLVRIIHLPTKKSRSVASIGKANTNDIIEKLMKEIATEISNENHSNS